MITRRLFALGLLTVPSVIRTPGMLMPVSALPFKPPRPPTPRGLVYPTHQDLVDLSLQAMAQASGIPVRYLSAPAVEHAVALADNQWWLHCEMHKTLEELLQKS